MFFVSACPLTAGMTQVLPLEESLRAAWNTKNFVTRSNKGYVKKQPFLVEASSKATIAHLNELMGSDYWWSCVALIAHLTRDAELVGSWAESCPCEEHQSSKMMIVKSPRRRRRNVAKDASAANCCFRCCRAPELATGVAMRMQAASMTSDKSSFSQYVAKAPVSSRAELQGAYEKGSGRLWGLSSWNCFNVHCTSCIKRHCRDNANAKCQCQW